MPECRLTEKHQLSVTVFCDVVSVSRGSHPHPAARINMPTPRRRPTALRFDDDDASDDADAASAVEPMDDEDDAAARDAHAAPRVPGA